MSKPRWLLTAVALFCALLPQAWATPELDRKYALETVGFLKSWDNVDGLFADYVANAYKDYFSKQSRFVLQDLSKAEAVLSNAKIPYIKLIDDPEILGQIARSFRSQSIIRTKIHKDGNQYRFSLEWLHAPSMEALSNDTFTLSESPPEAGFSEVPKHGTDVNNDQAFGLNNLKGALQASLDRMIAKVPFLGQVTGRDENSVTLNIGASAHLKKGDTVVIATIDEVKKHPLLKTIVEWRMTRTGKLIVDQVEDGLSFCRILEEEPGRPVARYQKVTQIIPKTEEAPLVVDEDKEAVKRAAEPPHLGWIAAGVNAGGYSREFSSGNGASGQTGGGFDFGGTAEGQLWLTREFFAELGFGYGGWGFSQQDIATGASTPASGVSGSMTQFRLAAGYTYAVNGDFFGPRAWLKVGFKSNSYSLPISTTEQTGPIGFHAFFIGIGGDLPIREKWGAILNLDYGIFTGASPDGFPTDSVNGSTDVSFFVGGYYRYTPKITFRAGLSIMIDNAQFSSGMNLAQKTTTFAPAALFYF